MTSAAIIVAAGSGKRFNSSTPKQFLKLNNKPVFLWSILTFKKIRDFDQIILVIPKESIKQFSSLANKYNITLAPGGKERFDSVRSGLSKIKDEVEFVAIHDAARPLIDTETIKQCLVAAKKHGAAIVAVKTKDTVKQSDNSLKISKTIPRDIVWLAQTPQIFKRSIIEKAYSKKVPRLVTDDAQLVESSGKKVKLVPGKYSNIKITLPEDLKIAALLMK